MLFLRKSSGVNCAQCFVMEESISRSLASKNDEICPKLEASKKSREPFLRCRLLAASHSNLSTLAEAGREWVA